MNLHETIERIHSNIISDLDFDSEFYDTVHEVVDGYVVYTYEAREIWRAAEDQDPSLAEQAIEWLTDCESLHVRDSLSALYGRLAYAVLVCGITELGEQREERVLRWFEENALHVVDSANGIYSGQIFAERFGDNLVDMSTDDLNALASGPDHDEYFDVWAELSDYSVDIDGTEYQIFESEGIFLVPVEGQPDDLFEVIL